MSKTQLTVSGRILWTLSPNNNPIERVLAKDKTSGQPRYDKAGVPIMQTVFSIGIPKGSPQLAELQAAQNVEILKLYPSGQVPKNFAMKMIDGDTDVDDKGKPYNTRAGHAGHMIVSMSNNFPVNWYTFDGVNYNEITDGIKVGDYVDVNFTLTGHGPSPKGGAAGFYVEPKAVLFRGVGDAIEKAVMRADPSKLFGQQAAPQMQQPVTQQFQQPMQGAQPTQQPFAGQGQPMTPQAGQVQQGFNQQQPQGQAVQPNYGGLPPQFRR